MATSNIHVCILTTAHPADDVRVNHKMGQAFRAAGFRVTWVGPNYTFFDPNNFSQYGIDYKFYPLTPGKIGRFMAYRNAYHYGSQIPDVDVFYAPDPDSIVVAVKLSQKNGAKVIFDIHELFHDYMLANWVKGPFVGIAGTMILRKLNKVGSACDLLVGVCENVLHPFQHTLTEKMIVRSCAPAMFSKEPPADVCASERKAFTLMHGKSSLVHGTDIVMEALGLAHKECTDIKCIMFGDFCDESRQRLSALGIEEVIDLRKGVPMQEMPSILRTCDAALIAYGRKYAGSLTNKLFEYMATGLPIIAPEYSSETKKIIEMEKCGLLIDFENPTSIAEAIIYLRKNPQICRELGIRAREAFEKRHNWEFEVQPLLDRIQGWF